MIKEVVQESYEDDDQDDDDDDFVALEPQPQTDGCVDSHKSCEFWSSKGECTANAGYMLRECKKSCNGCDPAKSTKKEVYRVKYGEAQDLKGSNAELLANKLEMMDRYMEEVVSGEQYDNVRSECINRNKLCLFWAFKDECKANPKFMTLQCAPACETCHLIDFENRCPMNPDAVDVFKAGDLNKMFERIVANEENVTVLSRPSHAEGEDGESASYQLGPWIITVDNFISDEECEKLTELGDVEGYARSTDVGKKLFDGSYEAKTSKTRTSENAWCNDECYKDPFAQSAAAKIEALTGVPEANSEYLQLLRYSTGQFYRTHHDYIGHHVQRPSGPRILTAFLYLNDVEAGGGTNFPDLDLTVMPKKGRVLLWPSVLDSDPNKKDYRTQHQALNVDAGPKFAANAWLHLRDFKEPHENGCT